MEPVLTTFLTEEQSNILGPVPMRMELGLFSNDIDLLRFNLLLRLVRTFQIRTSVCLQYGDILDSEISAF